jgi:DNA-binding CsgD family transcriptional regulator
LLCQTPAVHGGAALGVARPVGRAAEIEAAQLLLGCDPPAHLRVVAGPGMGASSFAHHVAASTGRPVHRVRADPASRSLAMGALAPLVSSPAEPLGTGPDVLVRAVARLLPEPARPPVVVVDGGEHLDDVSALVLAHAADAGATLVLTSARDASLPPALAALWRTAAGDEVALGPIDDAAVARLAADVLGNPVDPALVRALTRLVGGAPAAIVDVLDHARRDGSVVRVGSVWRLAGALMLPASARARAEALLDLLPPDERGAVDMLALAGVLPRPALERVVEPGALDSLDARGLIEHLPHDRVRLGDPLVRAARLDRLPAGTRRRLAQALRPALAGGAEPDVLLDAVLGLHAAEPLETSTVVDAARNAIRQGEADLAELVCRHGLGEGGPVEVAILLGEVLTMLGRSQQAEQLLAGLPVSRADDCALLAQTRVVNLAYHLDDVDGALALIDRTLEDLSGTAWSAEITGLRGVITAMLGHPREALRIVEPFLAAGKGRQFCQAATAAGPALVVLGRCLDAAELATRSYQERLQLGEQPLLAPAALHGLIRSFGLAEAGLFEEADAICAAVMAGAVRLNDREGQMWAGIMHGRSLLDQGRFDEAQATFEAAATAATDVSLIPHLGWARGGALLAAAQMGDVVATRHALHALEACPTTRLVMMAPDVLRARAWAAVVRGDLRAATDTLLDAAALADDSGEPGLAVLALYDLVRIGCAEHVDRLVGCAGAVQGDLAAARAQHGAALAAAEPTGLVAASERLEGLGALVLAAEAATHAAWTYRRSGQAGDADRMHARAARLRARRPLARTPALDLQPGAAYLTAREREVAALAAAGASSKEIAARLTISVRTVDNLLQRVYRKLGVRGRADLQRGEHARPPGLTAAFDGSVPRPRAAPASEDVLRPAARGRRR